MESHVNHDAADLARERQLRLDAEAQCDVLRAQEEHARSVVARLHSLSMILGSGFELRLGLQAVVDTFIEIHGADRGLLSLYDEASGLLFPAVSRGFSGEVVLALGQIVPGLRTSACGRAFASGQRTVIEDTETDDQLDDGQTIATIGGFRAVHSVPILRRSGGALGVLSAFFTRPCVPTRAERQVADLCALYAADAMDAARGRQATREWDAACRTRRPAQFRMALPLVTYAAAERPASGGPGGGNRPLTGRRVLVVDDNQDSADSLAMMLQVLGADVAVVYNGPAAVQHVEQHRPDIALLDIGMPGMSGYDVARELRSHADLGSLVLIALTGWGRDEDRRRSAEAGFDFHLVKPLQFETLRTVLTSPDLPRRERPDLRQA